MSSTNGGAKRKARTFTPDFTAQVLLDLPADICNLAETLWEHDLAPQMVPADDGSPSIEPVKWLLQHSPKASDSTIPSWSEYSGG